MKSLILAVNISEEDFSPSSVSEILMVALEKCSFNDLVLFLPCMGRKTEDFLFGLAKCCDMLGLDVCTDVFVDEKDKELISFEFLNMLKNTHPNFCIYSKEDEVYIGEQLFSCFELNKYSSDELDYFLEDIYGSFCGHTLKRNFAVSSLEDEKFLKDISSNFKCISRGEVQVFSRRFSRDAFAMDISEKLVGSKFNNDNNYFEDIQNIKNVEQKPIESIPVPVLSKKKDKR